LRFAGAGGFTRLSSVFIEEVAVANSVGRVEASETEVVGFHVIEYMRLYFVVVVFVGLSVSPQNLI